MWNGFNVQLWNPCRNSRKRKIAATPKLGAKNQLDCPRGYIKNTDTTPAIETVDTASTESAEPQISHANVLEAHLEDEADRAALAAREYIYI